MKKLTAIFLLATLFFSSCKKDPKIDDGTNVDPDSAYVSKPYIFPGGINSPRYRKIIIPADNPMTEEGVLLGRMLFYDPALSLDSSISCASCHKPEFEFGDGTALSKKIFNQETKRHTPPIINLGMNKRFFWDGRENILEKTVADALKGEQGFSFTITEARLKNQTRYTTLFKKAFGRPGDITEEKIDKALAQFMRSMISIDSKFDKYMRGEASLTLDEMDGLDIFNDNNKGDCFHCHADGPYLTFANQGMIFANNALDSAATLFDFKDLGLGEFTGNQFDNGRFKIPTLRNIERTAPYMHDGRFKTLEEVIDFYSSGLKYSPNVDPLMERFSQGGNQLTPQEKQKLLAFLKTLTDESFATNPKYQNPFK